MVKNLRAKQEISQRAGNFTDLLCASKFSRNRFYDYGKIVYTVIINRFYLGRRLDGDFVIYVDMIRRSYLDKRIQLKSVAARA